MTFIPSTILASLAFSFGKIIFDIPNLASSIHIGKTPLILLTFPSKDNSPIKTQSFIG